MKMERKPRRRMKNIRKSLGLYQKDIGIMVGIGNSGYANIERGGSSYLYLAKKIADVFSNLSGERLYIEDLFFEDEKGV